MRFRIVLLSLAILSASCIVQTESIANDPDACWDINGDGVRDPSEDVNDDGEWDIYDCVGPQGPPGDSVWAPTAGGIFYAGGNVGIGTPHPTSPLEVIGSATFRGTPDGAVSTMGFELSGSDTRLFSFVLGSDNQAGGWDFFSSDPNLNKSLLRIGLNGHVGVGTTAPEATLTVGQLSKGDSQSYSASVLRHGTADSPGQYSSSSPALTVFDYATDGPTTPDDQGIVVIAAPRIADSDPKADNAILLNVANDNGSALAVTGRRSVGIGTKTPKATLDVNGTARLQVYGGPPTSCTAERAGTIALTTKYRICVCNATKWASALDGTDCQW